MKDKNTEECEDCCKCSCKKGSGWKSRCGAYFLGFLGAAIYYIQQATGFWMGALGILKAIVWPAFIVHKLLGF